MTAPDRRPQDGHDHAVDDEQVAPGAPVARPGQRRRGLGLAREIVQTLALTLIIFFVIQTFIAQPFKVEQESMRRTLEPGDYVLVDRLTPRWDAYDRGDIVVFKPPESWFARDDTPFIKRVVGVAGDEVEIRDDGRLYVNQVPLDEPYVYQVDGQAQPTTSDETRWRVPDGEVFVVGDHRSNSQDSRVYGPIPVTAIVGRAWVRYWPFDAFGVLATPTYPALTGGAP